MKREVIEKGRVIRCLLGKESTQTDNGEPLVTSLTLASARTSKVRQCIADNSMVRVPHEQANVYIVKGDRHSTKVKWGAPLKGGVVMPQGFFKRQVFAYKAALATGRTIFVSQALLDTMPT